MLEELRTTMEAEHAYGEIRFPYFMKKSAPVSGQTSIMEYECDYLGEAGPDGAHFHVGIHVPIMTLCPCSKEISDRGAHNQRGTVSVTVKYRDFFWIEDVIAAIEGAASGGLYPLLKREDERHVTEYAYDHPVFVEDLVRNVCIELEAFGHFPWFSVEAVNHESIHPHDAFAYAERGDIAQRLHR